MDRNSLVSLIIGIFIVIFIGGAYILYLRTIFKQKVKLISNGLEDEEIKKEYIKEHKKSNIVINKIANGFSIALCILFCAVFVFSIYAQTTGNDFPVPGSISARVVQSGSMSKKHEDNKYLIENDLNDQFQTFDIILTKELPGEFELQLYDIVVYEVEEFLIVHRIIAIEEPNERHPEERWFTLKGDANKSQDRFPVRYSQMKAIYTGEYIPYCGAFILFFQSTLGYILIAILVFYSFIAPYSQKLLDKVAIRRLIEIGFLEEPQVPEKVKVVAYKVPDVKTIFHEEFIKVMEEIDDIKEISELEETPTEEEIEDLENLNK